MANKIKVVIENRQTEIKIPTGIRMLVRRSCNATLALERYKGNAEVKVIFTNNAECKIINKQYFGIEEPVEALSLPPTDTENPDFLGEVVISVEKVNELAAVYNRPFQMGMIYSASHGVFGLLGQSYTNDLEKTLLMEKEAQVLTELGYSPLSTVGYLGP